MKIELNENEIHHKRLWESIVSLKKQVEKGGGDKKIKQQHSLGKLTARERIEYLIDKGSRFYEIGTFAGECMYVEHGGCQSGGVITGLGRICNKLCVIVANDATVKAGAWFPITAKKNLRAQEIAMENHLPIVYLVDSAGIFLPLQDEVFADKEHFGRQFRNNAIMSSLGIPQIAAIMGSCVAGGAYLPVMCDEALIVEKTGSLFLAGPYLVKAAIGEIVDQEILGGAETHCEISGVTDYKCKDDKDCLKKIRDIVDKIKSPEKFGFERTTPQKPKYSPDEIIKILPADPYKPYDTHEIIVRITDNSDFVEYKAGYGQTLLCGYARIDGWAVGIVANQRKTIKTKKGEMQMGGVIYGDAADKAARFIMNCNQKKLPIVFLQDVTGFMVGSRAEHNGIIKDGAKMVNAVANSVVPKFTIIMGNSFGAGNYAMCGRAYDPRLMLAWPSAQIGVMGGQQAAKTLLQIKLTTLKAQGNDISQDEEKKIYNEMVEKYAKTTEPLYAAARLWIDEIIKPAETREWISLGIDMANHQKQIPKFNPGIIQV